jgi:hypothetical protein
MSKEYPNDFGAQGLLDHWTYLLTVPAFLSIIHFLQDFCFNVGFLDTLATNPHPPLPYLDKPPTLTPPSLGGIIDGLLGGGNKPTPTNGLGSGIGGLLGGILNGRKGSKTTVTPSQTSTAKNEGGSSGGGLFGFLDRLFGGGGGKQTTTATPTPTPTNGGDIGEFFERIFWRWKKQQDDHRSSHFDTVASTAEVVMAFYQFTLSDLWAITLIAVLTLLTFVTLVSYIARSGTSLYFDERLKSKYGPLYDQYLISAYWFLVPVLGYQILKAAIVGLGRRGPGNSFDRHGSSDSWAQISLLLLVETCFAALLVWLCPRFEHCHACRLGRRDCSVAFPEQSWARLSQEHRP